MSEKVRSEDELTPKQETFIAALLSLPTLSAASKAAGVTDKTGRLWLKKEHVQAAYKAARREAFDDTLAMLMTGTTTALKTLLEAMTDKKAPYGVRVHAAKTWLEQAIAVHKMSELEQEIAELRALVTAQEHDDT